MGIELPAREVVNNRGIVDACCRVEESVGLWSIRLVGETIEIVEITIFADEAEEKTAVFGSRELQTEVGVVVVGIIHRGRIPCGLLVIGVFHRERIVSLRQHSLKEK